MIDFSSTPLGALCDIPFSPLDWSGYDDIGSALSGHKTAQINLLSLPIIGQKFVANHRTAMSDKEPIPLKKLLEHLGVNSYRIISDKGVRTMEELRIRKALYVINIDSGGDLRIDALDDKKNDLGEEISRISFGNGDKPYVLLFGEKPIQTSPAVLSLIRGIRKITGAQIFPV